MTREERHNKIREIITDDLTMEQLVYSYLDCRNRKRNTPGAKLFELNLFDNLANLYWDLKSGKYFIGQSIAFVVTRPKYCEVFAADFRDRIVHHLVIRQLEPLFEEQFIEDTYNCRIGKGVLYGVTREVQKLQQITENYTKEAWILKCDMKGFFMSIRKDILLSRLKQFISLKYDRSNKQFLLKLIEQIILNRPEINCEIHGDEKLWKHISKDKSLFTNGEDLGLPIGNLTSQIFANFYLSEFDEMMEKESKGYYGRYVDDFIVLSEDKQDLLDLISKIRESLGKIGVTLHPSKIYLQEARKGVKFIGSVIKPGRIYTGNRTINNLLGMIKEESDPDKFIARWNSYNGFMLYTSSYGVRSRIWKENVPLEMKKKIVVRDKFKLKRYEKNNSNGLRWVHWKDPSETSEGEKSSSGV